MISKLSSMCISRGLIEEAKIIIAFDKLKAIIIRGHVGHENLQHLANKFYDDIAVYLEQNGYDVYFDDTDNNTAPINGDLWIGHCYSANKFKFAPEDIKLLALDSHKLKLDKDIVYINHPVDISSKTRGSHEPNSYHYIFTDKMKEAIGNITYQLLKKKLNSL